MTFYNTIGETGENLNGSRHKALTQEEVIYRFMQRHVDRYFTPFEIASQCFSDDVPITSVRRAISSLTDKGKLEKSYFACGQGKYGKANHVWKCCDIKSRPLPKEGKRS